MMKIAHLLMFNIFCLIITNNTLNAMEFEHKKSRGHKKLTEHVVDKEGNTLLHHAAETNNINLANRLIRNGWAIDVKNFEGKTPLNLARKANHVAMIKLLETNEHKKSRGHKKLTEHIVDKGNNLLHHAAKTNNIDLANRLIRNGWAIDVKNFEGETPLNLARKANHVAMIKLLEANENLFDYSHISDREKLDDALKAGAFVDVKKVDGNTPLLWLFLKNDFMELYNIDFIIFDKLIAVENASVKFKNKARETLLFALLLKSKQIVLRYKTSDGHEIETYKFGFFKDFLGRLLWYNPKLTVEQFNDFRDGGIDLEIFGMINDPSYRQN